MTTSSIASLAPQSVWHFFAKLAAVPRPSKHEERIRVATQELAAELGFECREDAVGNIVIKVPATPGHEQTPAVVLQGHLDMVCEKTPTSKHDPQRDPIALVLDKDDAGQAIVRADGTTLGADNGIGVAMALAAATDPNVKHGPLELLCTIDEEMGMTGAAALEPGFFNGKTFINLDSEEDDILYIGCAGGGDTLLTRDFTTEPIAAGDDCCHLSITGLRSGHSGSDIHRNRGNAIKVLAHALADVTGIRVVTIAGGSKRNVIAREVEVWLAGPKGTLATLTEAAEQVRDEASAVSDEPDLRITVTRAESAGTIRALSVADTRRLIDALLALPHGVLEMHQQIAGLVQTSNNVATIASSLGEDSRLRVTIGMLSRSSVDSRITRTRAQIAAVGRLLGASAEFGNCYPGWNPDLQSPLLATCQRVYERLFGEKPLTTAIHAGLECGIIGRRLGPLDMISFGPRIEGAHTTSERVYVESVGKSYRFLATILAEFAG
ncbi:MAG: beta-Ala-His dipeptidase [Phycisphaerae bacterium]|nr:beta-Ala-His dipeptidase [Phycisphaerae bacterium]